MSACVGISRACSSIFNFHLQTWFDWSMQVQVLLCHLCRTVLILLPVDRLRVLLVAHGQTWRTGKTMTTTWEMIRCQRHGNILQTKTKASSKAGFHGKSCQSNILWRFLCHLSKFLSTAKFIALFNCYVYSCMVFLGVSWNVARQQQWIDSQKSWSLDRAMHWPCRMHIHIQRYRTCTIHLDKHAKTNQ